MKLVKLSDTVLVNPDCIVAIEGCKGADKRIISVYLEGGKSFTTTRPAAELLRDIEYAQSSSHDDFFAG